MTTRVEGDDPFPLGSVTAAVLRNAPCSVRIERPASPETTHRWLVAVDLDADVDHTRRFLSHAGREALSAGVRVDLVYVGPAAERSAELDGCLLALPQKCRGKAHLLEGEVVPTLRRAAATCEALVLGTHGRQGLERLWLGSVTERMAMRAPHSVFVVRPSAT